MSRRREGFLPDLWRLSRDAAVAWFDDNAPSMGAALAFYSLFSLLPLLLIIMAIAGQVFGPEAVRGEVFQQLQGLLGASAARNIEDLLASASAPDQGVAATVLGVALLVIGAASVFGELQDALDRIWRVPEPPGRRPRAWWPLLRSRLLSFGMILAIAGLLMVSLLFSAVLAAWGPRWSAALGPWAALASGLDLLIGFGLTTSLFALIYKLMPRVSVQWRDVWLGAAVTAGLFTGGRILIGLYIERSPQPSAFGAAGSLIVVLLWVYYSAQICLLGAEFTWLQATRHGALRPPLQPEPQRRVSDTANS